jgi:Ser/Thr protein kinase RdoA (MazF antagonist)
MNETEAAAEKFSRSEEKITGVEEYGQGIIHDTYLVKFANQANVFILQRMNTKVFKNPVAIMHNLKLVTEHIQKRIKNDTSGLGAEWQMLQVIPATDGKVFFIDAAGNFWRALSFIETAVPLEKISGPADAGEVGRAIGTFHWLTSDLDPELLLETLPGFHNVEHYFEKYDAFIGRLEAGRIDEYCLDFIETRRQWASVLENGRRKKLLKPRIIHGDPKINNIMVNISTGRAVSIIDLDTVMPGLVHYDIGDALRSCCNIMGEEVADLTGIRFDLKRCEAFLEGYINKARKFLTNRDLEFFFDAVRLVPFELGLRFYTDFLEGNVYFKVNRKDQNLNRARVQFKLVESIEQQESGIRKLIAELGSLF